MSYQVGGFCYANYPDAAAAACAAMPPVTTVLQANNEIRTASCTGVSATTGRMSMTISDTHSTQGLLRANIVEQIVSFPPCQDQVKVDAYLILLGAAITAWATCYGLWRVYRFISSPARNPE